MNNYEVKPIRAAAFIPSASDKRSINLLSGARIKLDAPENTLIEAGNEKGRELLYRITDGDLDHHIDIHCRDYTFEFDIGSAVDVDRLRVYTFFAGNPYYGIKSFQAYAGETEDEMEKVIDCPDLFKIDKSVSVSQAVANDTPTHFEYLLRGRMRYFKIHIVSGSVDDISRITAISLSNDKLDLANSYVEDTLGEGFIDDSSPVTEGEVSGDTSALTNGIVFVKSVKLQKNAKLTFNADSDKRLDRIELIGTELENAVLFADGNPLETKLTVASAHEGRNRYSFTFSPTAAENYTVEAENATLDQFFATADSQQIFIDTEQTVCESFEGVGANVIPTAWFKEPVENGFNEVFWSLERRRVMQARPHVVRMWFQVDWIVDNEEDYINGNYDFNTPEMKSVCRYIEMFREADCDVSLNFGWKCGTKIQKWFAMDGIFDSAIKNSAPKDLKSFGKACAALLKELIEVRGYDNVKNVCLYNEPDYGCPESQSGDFVVPYVKDRYPYWRDMLIAVHDAAVENGIAENVRFLGTEGGAAPDWMTRLSTDCPFMKLNTVHRYTLSYENAVKTFAAYNEAAKGVPVALTEFGTFGRNHRNDFYNQVEMAIAAIRAGFTQMLIWILNGEYLPDPLNWYHAGGDMDNSFSFWDLLSIDSAIDQVGESFYELSLLMRYVPKYCRTVLAEAFQSTVRPVAFMTENGDITVGAECITRKQKGSVEITFKKPVNKTFYKYVYRVHDKAEPNLIIPRCEGKIEVESVLHDEIPEDYCFAVYSTIPPVGQIAMDEVEIFANAGEKVKIGCTLIDCDGETETFVETFVGEKGTLENGCYTMPESAKSGDMAAIRTQLKADPTVYGVSIVRIK